MGEIEIRTDEEIEKDARHIAESIYYSIINAYPMMAEIFGVEAMRLAGEKRRQVIELELRYKRSEEYLKAIQRNG